MSSDESDSNSDSGSGSESGSEETLKMSKEFDMKVKKYVEIDNQLRKLNEQVKTLKDGKKSYEEYIIKELGATGVKMIEIKNGEGEGGKLKLNKSETKAPIKKDLIKTALNDKVKDFDKVEEIVNMIEELRQTKTNMRLKRTFKKDK